VVFIKISAGAYSAIALTQEGRIFSWGSHTLGLPGFINDIFKPTEISPRMIISNSVSPPKFVDISAGGWHSLFLTETKIDSITGERYNDIYSSGFAFGRLGYERPKNATSSTSPEVGRIPFEKYYGKKKCFGNKFQLVAGIVVL